MTDARRSDRPSNPDHPDRDRDARIEELLLTGLDHYFAGRHDLAINIWTRVLFLDRAHGKARAYIERARGALAEKQREAEELLQTGADALTRGDRAAARELLTSAERAGGGEEALALLHRLDRLEAGAPLVTRPPEESPARPHRRDEPAGVSGREARLAWIFTGIATGILLAAIVGGYFWLADDPFELTVARSSTPALLGAAAAGARDLRTSTRPGTPARAGWKTARGAGDSGVGGSGCPARRGVRRASCHDPAAAHRRRAQAGRILAGRRRGRARHSRSGSHPGRHEVMRCPKCQYITFDSDDRCRNCGYEFSLSVESVEDEPVEVRIARDEPASARRGSESFSALDTPLNQLSPESSPFSSPERAAAP